MKNLKHYLIPSFLILLSVVLLLVLKKTPSKKMWDDYSVFYIEETTDENYIENLFKNYNIKDFISLKNQKVPLTVSENTPEYSLSLSSLEHSDYLDARIKYFFDKSGKFKIYYVENKYFKELNDMCSFIKDTSDFSCGVDSKESFPVFAFLILFAFFVFLVFKSEKKLLFVFASLIPLLYAFMLPFYSCFTGISLFLLGIFISLKLWNRKGGFKRLLKVRSLHVVFILSFFCQIAQGALCVFLYIMTVISVISVFYLYRLFEEKYFLHFSFKPVQIRSAKTVSLLTKKSYLGVVFNTIAIFLFFVASIFSFFLSPSLCREYLLLPSKKGSPSLVNLDDFFSWRWEALTFPYISLNSPGNSKYDKKSVSFYVYSDEPDAIKESLKVMSFDEKFIEDSLNSIENLSYPALEKMFLSQGMKKSYGYSSSGSQNVSVFTIMVVAVSLFVSAAFLLILKLNRNKNDRV